MPQIFPDFKDFRAMTRKFLRTPQDAWAGLLEPDEFDQKKFESAIEDIRKSRFLFKFLEDLEWTLKVTKRKVESECESNLIQKLETLSLNDNERLDIVCYGLGPFTSSVISRYQLAFLILLKDIVLTRTISIYDPIFSSEEKSILEDFGLNVLDVNELAKRKVFCRTIFFMPHCDWRLYNNLLWANWNKVDISKLIVIGNSFKDFHRLITKKYREKQIYLSHAFNFATEIKIVNNFKFVDIFNNLSLHYFHNINLSVVSSEVWNDNTEPFL